MFSSRLPTDLFTNLQTGETHQIYATVGQPLVLFSEIDGTSLASIHFAPSTRYKAKVDKDAKALIAPYPGKDQEATQRFQGLINKPDQEFQLTITNLCSKGMINFNLLKTNDAVTETNPGGINEINELRPFESYTVLCDQMNNLPLILQKFRDSVTKQTMTVEKDEAEQKEKKQVSKGTNIFLSVVPQENVKELVDSFAKTVWKVSDTIVVQYTKPSAQVYRGVGSSHGVIPESSSYSRRYSGDQNDDSDDGEEEDACDDDDIYDSGCEPKRSGLIDHRMGIPGAICNESAYVSKSAQINDYIDKKEEECDKDSDSDHEPQILSLSRAIPRTYESSNESCRIIQQSERILTIPRTHETLSFRSNLNHDTVKHSEIGTIAYGNERIDVHSAQTGIDYDYTVASRPCVLGLSINENLEFIQVNTKQRITDLTEDAKKLLDDIVNKKFEDFLKGKIYVSDQCAICLNENPDCVLYNCAHRCGHYDCIVTLSKCPVCRTYVSAKLRQSSHTILVASKTQSNSSTKSESETL